LRSRTSALIGQLSFSIYLLHLPVICSVGAWMYLLLLPATGQLATAIITICCVVAVTFALALPLARVDQWWLLALQAAEPQFRKLIGRFRRESVPLEAKQVTK
jgi:peptidoglycan/LPS O-acetylase OafA/YrhL